MTGFSPGVQTNFPRISQKSYDDPVVMANIDSALSNIIANSNTERSALFIEQCLADGTLDVADGLYILTHSPQYLCLPTLYKSLNATAAAIGKQQQLPIIEPQPSLSYLFKNIHALAEYELTLFNRLKKQCQSYATSHLIHDGHMWHPKQHTHLARSLAMNTLHPKLAKDNLAKIMTVFDKQFCLWLGKSELNVPFRKSILWSSLKPILDDYQQYQAIWNSTSLMRLLLSANVYWHLNANQFKILYYHLDSVLFADIIINVWHGYGFKAFQSISGEIIDVGYLTKLLNNDAKVITELNHEKRRLKLEEYRPKPEQELPKLETACTLSLNRLRKSFSANNTGEGRLSVRRINLLPSFFGRSELSVIHEAIDMIASRHQDHNKAKLDSLDLGLLESLLFKRWQRLTQAKDQPQHYYLCMPTDDDKAFITLAQLVAAAYRECGRTVYSYELLMPESDYFLPAEQLRSQVFPDSVTHILNMGFSEPQAFCIDDIPLQQLFISSEGYAYDINWIVNQYTDKRQLVCQYTGKPFSQKVLQELYAKFGDKLMTRIQDNASLDVITPEAIRLLYDLVVNSTFMIGEIDDYSVELTAKAQQAYDEFCYELGKLPPGQRLALMREPIPKLSLLDNHYLHVTVAELTMRAADECVTGNGKKLARVVRRYQPELRFADFIEGIPGFCRIQPVPYPPRTAAELNQQETFMMQLGKCY